MTVFQDNLSTLVLERNGAKPFSKASHTNWRIFKVRTVCRLTTNQIGMKGTLEMRADLHTEMISGEESTRHMESYMKIKQE